MGDDTESVFFRGNDFKATYIYYSIALTEDSTRVDSKTWVIGLDIPANVCWDRSSGIYSATASESMTCVTW